MTIVKDEDRHPELIQEMEELANSVIEIGIFGDEGEDLLMIARVHEFGVSIEVTPAMRGWFAWQGYPLSPDTTEIHIPERSYMRAGFDEGKNDFGEFIDLMIGQVLEGEQTAEDTMSRIGLRVRDVIRMYLRELSDPPLSTMTIERKGSSNPLIDTGRLWQSITWRVRER